MSFNRIDYKFKYTFPTQTSPSNLEVQYQDIGTNNMRPYLWNEDTGLFLVMGDTIKDYYDQGLSELDFVTAFIQAIKDWFNESFGSTNSTDNEKTFEEFANTVTEVLLRDLPAMVDELGGLK